MLSCLQVYATDLHDTSDCGGANTVSIGTCFGNALKLADVEMNDLYKKIMNQTSSKVYQTRLRDAQRAWIIFRDKSCLYENGTYEETRGTLWSLGQAGCQAAFTKQRVMQLQEYLKTCENHGC